MTLDIILFSVLAVFLFFKLRDTLGKGDESETPKHNFDSKNKAKDVVIEAKAINENVEIEDNSFGKLTAEDLKNAILEMKKIDANFSLDSFLIGAKKAFEFTIDAFLNNNKEGLNDIFATDLYKTFEKNIEEKKALKEYEASEIISIESADVFEANIVKKTIARIKIKFISEQSVVVKTNSGVVVKEKSGEVFKAEDFWVFERDLTSNNPNWKIIGTF